MCVVYYCKSSELQQYVLCPRTSARRDRVESLADVLPMDDSGADALRDKESSSSGSSSDVFKPTPRVFLERVPCLYCGSCSGLSTKNYFSTEFYIPCGTYVHPDQKRIFTFISYDLRKWKCRFWEQLNEPNHVHGLSFKCVSYDVLVVLQASALRNYFCVPTSGHQKQHEHVSLT